MSFWNHFTRLVRAKCQKRGNLKQRPFRIEALEERQLLAVTAGVFETAAAVLPADAAVWAAPQPVGETDDLGAPEDQPVHVPRLPDLAPSLSGAVTAVTSNSFVVKDAVVKNNGKGAASGYTVTVYASTDSTIDTSDIKLAAYSFGELASGASSPVGNPKITFDNLTVGETYYIGWIISDVEGEQVTENNTALCTKAITIPAAKAPTLTASLAGAAGDVTSSSFVLKDAMVKNIGNVAATGYTVTVYASTDSTIDTSDIELKSFSFGELAVDKASPVGNPVISISGLLTVGETYYIGWIISDVDGEQVTANNTALCTKAITIPDASDRAPDLAPSISGAASNVTSNSFVLKGSTVKNVGKVAASGYTVTVYASTDSTVDTGDIKLAEYSFGELGVGASLSLGNPEIMFNDLLTVGETYYVGWIISDAEGEVKTANNTATCAKPITIPAVGVPDLMPSISGAATAVTNSSLVLKGAVVKNKGKAAASGYTVTVYASTDSTIDTGDIKLDSYTFDELLNVGDTSPLGNPKIKFNDLLTVGETYYIGWIISDVEGEINTANNTALCTKAVTIPDVAEGAPDLVPSISGAATEITSNSFVLKGAMVKNNGKAAASGYTVTVYASTDSTIDTGDIMLESFSYEELGVGASSPLGNPKVSFDNLTVGETYYIGWIISDAEGETKTANNTALCTKPITIPGAKAPDLVPSLTGAASNVTSNSFVLKGSTVRNVGKVAASGYTVTVYASTDSTIDTGDIELKSFSFGELGVGASMSLGNPEISISGLLTVGETYYIGWIISDAEGEVNTANNTATCAKPITIAGANAPDLAPSLSGAASNVTSNSFVLKGSTVKNVGKVAASGYTVTVYASTDSRIDTGDIELKSFSFEELGVGASAPLGNPEISISGLLTVGETYYIGWIISDVEGETIIANNTAKCTKPITIPEAIDRAPDLTPSVTGAASEVTSNSFVLAGSSVKNNGKAVANGYTVTVYASTDSTIDTSDIELESFSFDALGVGASAPLGNPKVSFKNLTVGETYYIGWIISDVEGEQVAANNTAQCVKPITIPGAKAPDLAPSLSGVGSTVTRDSFILKGATVKNIGKVAASGYTVTVYASTDSTIDTDDIELASYSFGALDVDTALPLGDKVISISNLTAGETYYVGWIISDVEGEINTANNTARSKTIKVPAAKAGLLPEVFDTVFDDYIPVDIF